MAKGIAGPNSITKFGSKSNPGKGHFYKWDGGKSGEGTGHCMYCPAKLRFEPKGPKGGKVRRYWNKGHWTSTEPACRRKEVAAKTKAKAA